MTTNNGAGGLVAKWREESNLLEKSFDPSNTIIALERRRCARELEAALQAPGDAVPCKTVIVYGDDGPEEREPVEDYYTAPPSDALRRVVCEDECGFMRLLAERITANAHPEEDGRLEVAYAIARYLELDWPAAYDSDLFKNAARYLAIRNPPGKGDAMCAWSTTEDGELSARGKHDGPLIGEALDAALAAHKALAEGVK